MSQPEVDASGLTESQQKQLRSIVYWTDKMDGQWSIFGVPVGWDAVLGVLPIAGDTLTACVSLLLLNKARRIGVPKRLLLRMLLNIVIDFFGGALPVLGDAFDLVWRANTKNLHLLERYYGVESAAKDEPDHWGAVIGVALLISIIALALLNLKNA